MKMNGKVYDVLKFVVWLWIPLATFIITFSDAWFTGATWIDPLQKTFVGFEVFLGALVSKSNYDYNKTNKEVGGETENDDASDD